MTKVEVKTNKFECSETAVHNNIVDFLYGLDSIPEWCQVIDVRESEYGGYLLITLYGSHTIALSYEEEYDDYIKSEYAWGRADMEYALEIMDNRDEILALAKKMFNK